MTKADKPPHEQLIKTVDQQAQRKLTALHDKRRSLWFGLGMFGLVGWSVALPTVAGIVFGLWLDKQWPSHISWTLTFLFVGICIGCFNAWHWINKERNRD